MNRVLLFIVLFFSNMYSFEIYVDNSEKLDIDNILSQKIDFLAVKGVSHNIEHTNKPIWIKKTLTNFSKKGKSYIVNLRPTIIQNVEFYIIYDNKIETFKDLDRQFLTVEVAKNSVVDVYVKFYHSDSLVIFQVFDTPIDFIYKYESKLVENLIFLTILFIIVIYTFILYFHIKKIYFIYYAIYLISIMIGFGTYTVVWPIFISFEPSIFLVNTAAAIMYSSSLLFITSIINFKSIFPQYNKFVKLLFFFYAILVFFTILDIQKDFTSSYMRICMLLNVVSIIWILFISLKKVKIVKHLLIGWSAYTVAVIVNNLLHFGLLPYNFFTTNAFEFGTIFENFTFAYVLGLQLKMINDERVKLLEEKHQKESFFHAQSKFALAGQVLFQIEHEWRRPLSYIPAITSTLQSKIFTKQVVKPDELNDKLIEIDKAVKTIQSTMDEFKKFYTPDKHLKSVNLHDIVKSSISHFKNVTFSKNIAIDLDLQEVVINTYEGDWKHIVLNLLQNSIDNSTNTKETKIFIKLKRDKDILVFSYKDNCGGVDDPSKIFEPFYSTKKQSGIGLFMVRYIVTERFVGDILAVNENEGLKTTIKLYI